MVFILAKPFDEDDIDMFDGFDDDDDFGMGSKPNFGNFNNNSMNNGFNSSMSKGARPSPSFNMGNNNFNSSFGNDAFGDDFGDEPEFTGDSGYDDAPIQESKSGPKMDSGESKEFKKASFILIAVGVLVLIFAVVGIRVVKSVKNSPTTTTVVQQSDNYINDSTNQNFVSSQKVDNSVTNNFVSSASVWQEVKLDGVDLGELWIDSTFTITELHHYALVTNTQNDKQVKSVVKGNISGLVGTYEMEIPTYMALKVSVGTTFSVTYQLKEQNGYKLIGEIRY